MADVEAAIRAGLAKPPQVDFRVRASRRWFSALGVGVLGIVTLGFAFVTILAFRMSWALGLFIALLCGFMAALTDYVWRDLRGIWGMHIVLDVDKATLDLPTGRSLIHRPPELHLTIPYSQIASIETRLEGYGSIGLENIQRAYVLRRRSGELIYLFEERAVGTSMESSDFSGIAAELAERAGVDIRELGMVEGKGGVLAVWGTSSPDWSAPSISLARQARLRRRAVITGAVAFWIIIIALSLRTFTG
jgi:hypothetical protein